MKREKITLDRIEQWARRNPALVMLCIVVIISSSVVSLLDGGARLREVYRHTLGRNSRNYENIEALATETHIDYFSSLLGPPVFKNRHGTYREHIFVNPNFYVQAVTNTDGTVLLYSVTTRSRRFNPRLNLGIMESNGETFIVVLGKTTFAKIRGEPIKIEGSVGARRMSYREKYYFGNPGLYQNYNFVLCDAGNVPDGEVNPGDVKYESMDGIDTQKLPSRLMRFRETCPINTFSVSAPHSDIDDKIPAIGPDYDQVRVLK